MATSENDQQPPPSYDNLLNHKSNNNNNASSLGPGDQTSTSEDGSQVLHIRLVHNKPCKAPMDPTFETMVWNDSTVIRWVDEVILMPPSHLPATTATEIPTTTTEKTTFRSLGPEIRERIQQRFALDHPHEELYMFLLVKLGHDNGSHHRAPRILVHRGNEHAVWKLLLERNTTAMLQVWFGEVKAELFTNKMGKLSTRKIELSEKAERLDLLSSSASASSFSGPAPPYVQREKEGFGKLGL